MSDFLSRTAGGAMGGQGGGAGGAGGAGGGDPLHGSPLGGILGSLMGGQSGASGLGGLVERLRGGGLGEQVDSWVGTGENRPVSPQQLEMALGQPEADRLARQAGVPREGLMGVLASLLPSLVDRATPNGQLPRGDGEIPHGGLGGVLGSLLGGGAGASSAGGGLGGLLGSLQGGPMGAGQGGGLGGVLGSLLGGGVGRR